MRQSAGVDRIDSSGHTGYRFRQVNFKDGGVIGDIIAADIFEFI